MKKKTRMDRFQFYSKSKPEAPGLGASERLVSHPDTYKDLPRTFRQTLSNFSLHPTTYNKILYPSVEHAFHAAKILRYAPEATRDALAYRFSQAAIDAKSPLAVGLSGVDVKRAGGKRGLFCMSPEQCKDWETEHLNVMKELWKSKFKNNADARDVLLGTKNAELWHFMRAKPPQRWTGLEEVRKDLRTPVIIDLTVSKPSNVVDLTHSDDEVTLDDIFGLAGSKRKRD